jgi:pimeloyl-ACP methyl ester carboxylesterase
MSAIILRSEVVHYEVLGRGRPLIFLHGWVGSWRYWITAMQAASISFRAYALDFWGFGDSGKAISYYSLEQQTDLLEEFIEELGIARIAIIGHGLGSIVASIFATRHPQTVDRLMLVSLPFENAALNLRLQSATGPELTDWLLGNTPAAEPARLESPKTDHNAILVSSASLQNVDLAGKLRQLSMPHLLVYGSSDPLVAPPHNDQLNNLPEHAHQIIFEESGHFPMLDEPNKFNRLLVDFLGLESGESPRQLQLKDEWKRRVR